MKHIIFTFVIFIFASKAFAYGSSFHGSSYSFGSNDQGFVIVPQAIYYFYSQNTGNTTTVTRWSLDGSLGYHFNMFYLGGEYLYDVNATTYTSNTQNSTDTYKAYGAQLGIMTENIHFLFTYFFGSSATTAGGTSSEKDYTNGSGYQVAFAYLFDLAPSFYAGPEFEYRSITYTALSNGQAIGTNFAYTTLIPMVAFKYYF